MTSEVSGVSEVSDISDISSVSDASGAANGAAANDGNESIHAFPCDIDGVKALLPHREPFIWVTRILECDPGQSIVAELDVSPDLAIFEGHFPGEPIFPGVLIMEALAQAACCCIFAQPDKKVGVGFLAGIDKARFRAQVVPGDTVRLEAQIVQSGSRFCKAEVHAYKGDVLAAEAIQRYMMQ